MDTSKLNLKPGEWIYVNCGDMPSEKNCQLVMMAPRDQMEDLKKAETEHMITSHGHTREAVGKMMEESGDEMVNTITVS